jgi:hypothetical protein
MAEQQIEELSRWCRLTPAILYPNFTNCIIVLFSVKYIHSLSLGKYQLFKITLELYLVLDGPNSN